MIVSAVRGSRNVAVPTCTAAAPANRNCRASSVAAIPPIPTMGTSHDLLRLIDEANRHGANRRTRHASAARSQKGPPALYVNHHSQDRVDQRDRVRPRALHRPRDGPDVADVGRELRDHRQFRAGAHRRHRRRRGLGRRRKVQPAGRRWDTTGSPRWRRRWASRRRRPPGRSSSRRRAPTRSRSTGHGSSRHIGAFSRRTPATPGFGKPIELSMPAGVSTVRGVGLPSRASGVTVLVTMAPSRLRSTRSRYSSPNPKVPEAVSTGERNTRPSRWDGARFTVSAGAIPARAFHTSKSSTTRR